MSNMEDRMERMLLLCYMNKWSLETFKEQLQERYPNGPYPDGHGWDWAAVESDYFNLMKVTK